MKTLNKNCLKPFQNKLLNSKKYQRVLQEGEVLKSEEGHNHHIIPKSLGGADDSKNIVRLSYIAHSYAHSIIGEMLQKDGYNYLARKHYNASALCLAGRPLYNEVADQVPEYLSKKEFNEIPYKIGEELITAAACYIKPYSTILIPGAGWGNLLQSLIKVVGTYAFKTLKITLIEKDEYLMKQLVEKFGDNANVTIIKTDFLTYDFNNKKFDLILMNPPFSKGKEFFNKAKELSNIIAQINQLNHIKKAEDVVYSKVLKSKLFNVPSILTATIHIKGKKGKVNLRSLAPASLIGRTTWVSMTRKSKKDGKYYFTNKNEIEKGTYLVFQGKDKPKVVVNPTIKSLPTTKADGKGTTIKMIKLNNDKELIIKWLNKVKKYGFHLNYSANPFQILK